MSDAVDVGRCFTVTQSVRIEFQLQIQFLEAFIFDLLQTQQLLGFKTKVTSVVISKEVVNFTFRTIDCLTLSAYFSDFSIPQYVK